MHHFGIFLQIVALTMLPMVVLFQLNFGIQLITMPVVTIIGVCIFMIGTSLREKFK